MENIYKLNMATRENDPRCRTILKQCKDLGLRVHFQVWLDSLQGGRLTLNTLLAQQPEDADRILDGIIGALEKADPVAPGESPPQGTIFNVETCTLESILSNEVIDLGADGLPMDDPLGASQPCPVTTDSGLPMSEVPSKVSAVPELQEELRAQFEQGQVPFNTGCNEDNEPPPSMASGMGDIDPSMLGAQPPPTDPPPMPEETKETIEQLKELVPAASTAMDAKLQEDTLEGFREHLKETRARVDLQMAASAALEDKFTQQLAVQQEVQEELAATMVMYRELKEKAEAVKEFGEFAMAPQEIVAITTAILDEVRKICVLRQEFTGIVDLKTQI